MYLGIASGNVCTVSKNATNNHVLITGQSGSGKSCRMQEIELYAALKGETVVVMDLAKTHAPGQIWSGIASMYEKNINRIVVEKQGISSTLIIPELEDPIRETRWKNAVVQILASAGSLSRKQKSVLRSCVSELSYEKLRVDFQIEIKEGLYLKRTRGGEDVFEKLWPLFSYNMFRHDGGVIIPGRINIFSFGGIEIDSQVSLASILLAALWELKQQDLWKGELTIFLDEFQNLPHGKTAVLRRILREGRKFKFNLVLATQTLEEFSDDFVVILQEAAARLYFRPVLKERRSLAAEIDPDNPKKWVGRLERLAVGRCVTLGEKVVNGRNICRPLILSGGLEIILNDAKNTYPESEGHKMEGEGGGQNSAKNKA